MPLTVFDTATRRIECLVSIKCLWRRVPITAISGSQTRSLLRDWTVIHTCELPLTIPRLACQGPGAQIVTSRALKPPMWVLTLFLDKGPAQSLALETFSRGTSTCKTVEGIMVLSELLIKSADYSCDTRIRRIPRAKPCTLWYLHHRTTSESRRPTLWRPEALAPDRVPLSSMASYLVRLVRIKDQGRG